MESATGRLIERFDLRHKNVLEIACGCGYFLRSLCEQGPNHGVGIDPTVIREETQQVGQGSVRFIRDLFSDRYADIPTDFVCCLSAFEHIPAPWEFLESLRRTIGDRRPGVYFEIFNAFEAFRREETWSIHYEQCNYFSSASFADIFRRSGFDIIESGTCYEGDQYLFVDAVPGERVVEADGEYLELLEELARFAASHQRQLASDPPDTITNALYEREMRQQARDIGVDCEFLIA